MKKKKLFSSLAVTSMIINPMASSVFANSSDISSSTTTEIESTIATEVDDSTDSNDSTETSNAGSLSRCTPNMNAGSLSRCGSNTNVGIVGNGELDIPAINTKTAKIQGSTKHVVEQVKDGKSTLIDRFMTYDCDKTHDEYIVRVFKTGDSSNSSIFDNFKVEYTVTTTPKYENLPASTKPGCHNIKGEKQVNFTGTTQNGATLGNFPGMQLDEKTEFNDAKHTIQYKFHCVANGGGEQYIDINFNPQSETVSKVETTSKVETISTEEALKNALNNKNLDKVVIDGKINVNSELTVNRSDVTIIGVNGGTIDFQNKGSLVLKANNIKLSDLTIQNSAKAGVQVYKANGVTLDNVSVENSKNYGILVNASTVTLNNCSTSNNKSGGMMICRATNILSKHSGKDSNVTVTGTLTQNESSLKVMLKNERMLDVAKNSKEAVYYMQDNKFDISNLVNKKDYEKQSKTQNNKTFDKFYDNNVKKALDGINIDKYKKSTFEEVILKYNVK